MTPTKDTGFSTAEATRDKSADTYEDSRERASSAYRQARERAGADGTGNSIASATVPISPPSRRSTATASLHACPTDSFMPRCSLG